MIKVSGSVRLYVNYTVKLNMTEAEFDALSYGKQESLVESHINYYEAMRGADVSDIDIDELEEVEDEK